MDVWVDHEVDGGEFPDQRLKSRLFEAVSVATFEHLKCRAAITRDTSEKTTDFDSRGGSIPQ